MKSILSLNHSKISYPKVARNMVHENNFFRFFGSKKVLNFITPTSSDNHSKAVLFKKSAEFFASGGHLLQIRDKENVNTTELEEFLSFICPIAKRFKGKIILNDNVDKAKHFKLDGVHLGQSDEKPEIAREKLGKHALIGLTVTDFDQIEIANLYQHADYLGLQIWESKSKKVPNSHIFGVEGLKAAKGLTNLPIIGIGGINKENAKHVIAYGAEGVAVIGAIKNTEDASLATKELINEMKIGKNLKEYLKHDDEYFQGL